MQFTTIPVALTATLASGAAIENLGATHQLAKRGCYSGGEGWAEQKENALAKARDFCSIKPADFNEGQGFGRCYNLSNTKRVDFNIGNISSSRRMEPIHWPSRSAIRSSVGAISTCPSASATTLTRSRSACPSK